MKNTLFYDKVRNAIQVHGGFHNAHLHLDRANTLDDGMVDQGRVQVLESSHISLQKKHALIATVHAGPAYDSENLLARVGDTTEVMIEVATRRADTMVDVTPDRVGLTALETIQGYAKTVADQIEVQAAAYTPLGFSDDTPEQWDVFSRC